MNKVSIEATGSEVVITVELDGQTWKQTWVTKRYGATSRGHDFEEVAAISDELYEALGSIPVLDLMSALETGAEEYDRRESEDEDSD